jgi:hypothetical protein
VHRLLTAAQHSGRQRHRFQPHDRTPWWPGAQRPCVGGRRTAGRRQRQQTSRRQVEHLVDRRHHHAPATDRGTALRSATTTGSPAACPSGPRGGPVLNSPASVGAVPTEGRTSHRSSSTTTHWLMAPAEHPLVAAAPAVSRSPTTFGRGVLRSTVIPTSEDARVVDCLRKRQTQDAKDVPPGDGQCEVPAVYFPAVRRDPARAMKYSKAMSSSAAAWSASCSCSVPSQDPRRMWRRLSLS